MPQKPRPGMVGRYVELPEELDNQLREYAERIGSGFAAEVRLAIRRHLAYPPSPQPPPLPTDPAPLVEQPTGQADAPPAGKGKRRRKGG